MRKGTSMAQMNYTDIGKQVGDLVTEKNTAYGDSFGKSSGILRILYPNGISPDQYDDSLTVTRIIDKLFRIATAKDALGESPYRDIAGYALLSVKRDQDRKEPSKG